MVEISCHSLSTREINGEIRRLIREGETEILVKDPGARHNLGVALLQQVRIRLDGSVGYYCAGMNGGASFEIAGGAGWGLAESMLSGHIVVKGSAGNGAAAAIRGGSVVIYGDAAARLGVSMKGGQVVVAGNCGYMAGFMGQRGTLIICGDVGEAFADSMYESVCFVGGRIAELGNDAIVDHPTPEEADGLEATLAQYLSPEIRRPPARNFKKVVSGRKLWNFDQREWKLWQEAL